MEPEDVCCVLTHDALHGGDEEGGSGGFIEIFWNENGVLIVGVPASWSGGSEGDGDDWALVFLSQCCGERGDGCHLAKEGEFDSWVSRMLVCEDTEHTSCTEKFGGKDEPTFSGEKKGAVFFSVFDDVVVNIGVVEGAEHCASGFIGVEERVDAAEHLPVTHVKDE